MNSSPFPPPKVLSLLVYTWLRPLAPAQCPEQEQLTPMEQPTREPLFKAVSRISQKFSGASPVAKVSATPPGEVFQGLDGAALLQSLRAPVQPGTTQESVGTAAGNSAATRWRPQPVFP